MDFHLVYANGIISLRNPHCVIERFFEYAALKMYIPMEARYPSFHLELFGEFERFGIFIADISYPVRASRRFTFFHYDRLRIRGMMRLPW